MGTVFSLVFPSVDFETESTEQLDCYRGFGPIKDSIVLEMPLYNFKSIQPVPTANDFVDIVLSKTQRQTPTVVHNGMYTWVFDVQY